MILGLWEWSLLLLSYLRPIRLVLEVRGDDFARCSLYKRGHGTRDLVACQAIELCPTSESDLGQLNEIIVKMLIILIHFLW